MNSRWLPVGIIVLLVLGYLAWDRRQGGSGSREDGALVTRLLPFDINEAARIESVSASATATLVRAEAGWTVSELWGYPADFERVTENLRLLSGIKGGQVIRGGTNLLVEFGLSDNENAPADSRPRVIRFHDAAGGKLASLAIGRPREGAESVMAGGGVYVRVDDGPVLLLGEDLGVLPRGAMDWAETTLLNVDAADIESISVAATGSSYTVRSPSAGEYAMDGLSPGEEVKKDVAGRLFGVLMDLFFGGIADPSKSESDMGLGVPEEFQAKTRDGVTYAVQIGGSPDDVNRYARLFVFYTEPETPDEKSAALKAEVERMSGLFSKWVYVLPNYTCQTMLTPRSDIAGPVAAEAPAGTAPES